MSPLFAFSYHNPTQIHFGHDSFAALATLVPADARVLLLYGGGSIKANGVHAQVTQALAAHHVVEFGGVEPNPTLETLTRAVAVVTRAATREKRVFYAQPTRPRFAILNPRVMASLPDRQLANGLVDAFVHVCEQYLTYPTGALVQDGYAEAVLRALKTLADSFERRREPDWGQNLMWAANQALCGIIGVGVPQDWATHRLAVQLTALYDIDHGRTLSIVQPWVLREGLEARRAKLEQMGRQVFGLQGASAEAVVAAIEAMYRGLGMPLHLREAGVDEADAAGRVLALARAQGHVPFRGAMPLAEGQVERVIRGACG